MPRLASGAPRAHEGGVPPSLVHPVPGPIALGERPSPTRCAVRVALGRLAGSRHVDVHDVECLVGRHRRDEPALGLTSRSDRADPRYGQRSLRLKVIASNGPMLIESSSFAAAISTLPPSRSSMLALSPIRRLSGGEHRGVQMRRAKLRHRHPLRQRPGDDGHRLQPPPPVFVPALAGDPAGRFQVRRPAMGQSTKRDGSSARGRFPMVDSLLIDIE